MDFVKVRPGTLPPDGRTFVVRLTPEEVSAAGAEAPPEGAAFAGPVEARVQVLPSGRDLFVLGTLRCRAAYRCVRCLERFERDVEESFHVTFVPGGPAPAGETELHREDLDLESLGPDGEVDLGGLVADQAVLALDAYPVCADGCRGLCPRCGADRNRDPCGCADASPDPRLAVLADWKRRS